MTISKRIYANNAKTTLASSVTPSDTVLQVTDGSRFPNPAAGEYFLVTIEAGSSVEVIKVNGRSGNSLTGCERAQENTIAANFSAGARVENRITRDTLDSFARKQDRLAEVTLISDLDAPNKSDSNSYICQTRDDSGNPIVAIKNTATAWRFPTHTTVRVTGAATANTTTTTITSTDISTKLDTVVSGKYLIQFITGNNTGLVRNVTVSGNNTATWGVALPNSVATGDQFEIYKSDASIITELLASSDDGLIYSILLSD